MVFISEADVVAALLDQLEGLGYTRLPDGIAGPDGSAPERASYSDVVLVDRLKRAVDRLNPDIPSEARQDALKKVIADETPSLIEENRRIHRALVEGIDVEFYVEDGTIRGDKVRLIDFGDPSANDWLVADQFTVIEHGNNRRPDVVVFVNGLPLGAIELKNPGTESATLTSAYNQLQTYKSQIPSLFRTNAVLVTSDGLMARIGSLTANEERFMPWRTTDGTDVAAKGSPEMSVLIEGVFEQRRFLDLIRDFTVFGDTGSGISKIIAGYHQYHAVRHAVKSTVGATSPEGNRKVGVIWHTQGSGKSLLMAFYAGQLVRRPELQNPTIVVMTDRNDLDDQLFGTFSMCRDLIRQTPIQAENREDLQKALNRASGGVIFTTIQKFAPARSGGGLSGADGPAQPLVVVIADEAHRSQYGFKARVEQKTGEIAYGFAKYLGAGLQARCAAQRLFHRAPIYGPCEARSRPRRPKNRRSAEPKGRAFARLRIRPTRPLSPERRSRRTTPTRPPCSASTSTFMTSAGRSRTAQRCRFITKAGWRNATTGAHRTARRGKTQNRRRDRGIDRGRGDNGAGTPEAQMVDRRSTRRRGEAPQDGGGRSGAAFRGPGPGDGRQGHGGLHEPPHLRRFVHRDHRPSPRLAFRRR